MKFSWQFESYKIEKASSSTSCKRLEPTPHSGKWAHLFCNYNRLQTEHGVGLHRVHTRVASVRLVGEGACFSGLMTHLSVQGRSAGTISFNFQTVHVASVIIPLYGKELREVKWVIQSHMCQSCATRLSSASPFQGDHEEQWTLSPSAALRDVLPLVVPQNPCTQGYELPKTWKLSRSNETSGWTHHL